MKAKDYLRGIAVAEDRIRQKKYHLKKLKGNYNYLSGIDYSRDPVQTSARDALGDMVVRELSKMDELHAEILRDISRFEEERNRIINQIQGMPDSRHADLLFRRYVQRMGFKLIAREMGYTYEYTINLHGIALCAFKEQYLTEENPDA